MIKALLLDFYGVIQTDNLLIWVDTYAPQFPGLRERADEICRRLDLDEITLDEYYQALATAVGIPTEQAEHEMANEVAINKPLLDYVDELRNRGVNVSILSNDGSSLRGYIEALGIAHYFDDVYISGEIGMMKPDLRIYQYVTRQLKIHPDQILFIDDKQSNVEGARRAGLQAEVYQSVAHLRQLLL